MDKLHHFPAIPAVAAAVAAAAAEVLRALALSFQSASSCAITPNVSNIAPDPTRSHAIRKAAAARRARSASQRRACARVSLTIELNSALSTSSKRPQHGRARVRPVHDTIRSLHVVHWRCRSACASAPRTYAIAPPPLPPQQARQRATTTRPHTRGGVRVRSLMMMHLKKLARVLCVFRSCVRYHRRRGRRASDPRQRSATCFGASRDSRDTRIQPSRFIILFGWRVRVRESE